jgi:hypothetical protein
MARGLAGDAAELVRGVHILYYYSETIGEIRLQYYPYSQYTSLTRITKSVLAHLNNIS